MSYSSSSSMGNANAPLANNAQNLNQSGLASSYSQTGASNLSSSLNNSNLVTCTGQSCPGCQSTQCLSSKRVVREAPIQGQINVLDTVVHEQHVRQQQAPNIQEKHVIQEKHITKEQPIIEKKIIHEQPIVQQRTVIHEKPVIHERTIVQRQEEVIHEKPIYQQAPIERVRETATVVNEGISYQQAAPIHKYDQGFTQQLHTNQPIQQQSMLNQQQPMLHQQQQYTAPLQQGHIHNVQQPMHTHTTTTAPMSSMAATSAAPIVEPTLLHETVSGSPVYDRTKLANSTSTSRQEDALRHQTDMNQALAGENDRIAANLKAAAAEREILAHLDAAKAPGTATTAKVGKHTSSA